MRIDRRRLLGLIGTGSVWPAGARAQGRVAFDHGVASGDPHPDSLLIWTRVTTGGTPAVPIAWRLWAEDGLEPERSGAAEASGDRDFTVKVIVDRLSPGRTYRYAFEAGPARSPEGTARTLPIGPTPEAVLAVVSCQKFEAGYFNAHRAIARLKRLDVVIHLGDYIYEYRAETPSGDESVAASPVVQRTPDPPHSLVTLADYRRRHAQYKTDPDLQAAHARAAFICVWDDHEIANDAWTDGAENHDPETEGGFAARRAAALRAYLEWMPIREPAGRLDAAAINRTFDFGDLARLAMLETRLTARDRALNYQRDLDDPTAEAVAGLEARRLDPERALMGPAQIGWLADAMGVSRAQGQAWQLIGSQVLMARVKGPDITRLASPARVEGLLAGLPPARRALAEEAIALFQLDVPFNLDAWDGYPAERERVYAALKAVGVSPVVLSGDSHAFWASDLIDAAGEMRGVELGTTSITSPSTGDALGGAPLGSVIVRTSDDVRFCNQNHKGFLLLIVRPEAIEARMEAVATVAAPDDGVRTLARWRISREPDGGLSHGRVRF